MNHHVVAIYILEGKGYRKRLASYTAQSDALIHAVSQSNRSATIVYRDGTTGKRYSQNEAKALLMGKDLTP